MRQLIKKYIRPLLPMQIGVIIIISLNVTLMLFQPILMKKIIDAYSLGTLSLTEIGYFGVFFLVLLFGGFITGFYRDLLIFKTRILLQFRLRNDIYAHNLKLSYKQPSGKIISMIYNDVDAFTGLLNQAFIAMFTDLLTIIATIFILYLMNWKLATISLFFVPIYFLVYSISKKRIFNLNKKSKKQFENLTEVLQLGLKQKWTSIRFNRQKYSCSLFCREQINLIRTLKKLFIQEAFLGGVSNFLSGFIPVLLLLVGGLLLISKEITLGTLVAFSTYIVKFLQPVSRLTQLNVGIQSAVASAERILDFFSQKDEWPGYKKLDVFNDMISVENLVFSYGDGKNIFNNLTFKIEKNEMIAIVGESGSGKSTLVKLLSGEIWPLKGSIYYDQNKVHSLAKNSFYNKIAVVTQEELLIAGTIFENIAFGNKKATFSEVIEICEKLGLHSFISSLPQQYNTYIIPEKNELSVGQKQRIATARALIHNADILIFDEITSALDAETESVVLQLLSTLKGKCTIIVIAHKFQNVIHADRIFVLQNGQIVEQGNHAQLLSQNKLYANLYNKQKEILL